MGNEQIISIANGVGSIELVNGTYNVVSSTLGYNNTSINPTEIEVVEGTDNYSFTIAATGTLTLHITDNGTNGGTSVVGAKFARCDSEGNTYGDEITTDEDGNAVFNYVPFAEENAPIIYYKQTASDGNHNFDDTLKNTTLLTDTFTIEILNSPAETRNFSLTDTNYSGLPIANGQITLS